MESYSDSLLLKKIRKGDFNAFEILYRRYFPRLKAFSAQILADDELAKDIVQEVFIKVWEKRAVILDIAIEAYLFRLVRNKCYNHLRDQKIIDNRTLEFTTISGIEELYRITEAGNEPFHLIEAELEEELQAVLKKLPEKTRDIFRMSRLEGMSNKEIAEALSVSVKSVEKHITGALRLYKQFFRDRNRS
jgi:RNA polymerase sigma-70 factor (family 1)